MPAEPATRASFSLDFSPWTAGYQLLGTTNRIQSSNAQIVGSSPEPHSGFSLRIRTQRNSHAVLPCGTHCARRIFFRTSHNLDVLSCKRLRQITHRNRLLEINVKRECMTVEDGRL